MKNRIIRYVSLWLALLLLMTIGRIVFFVVETAYTWSDLAMLGGALWHGLPGDLSMSAYLMAIPSLWLVASVWVDRRWMERIMTVYLGVVAGIVAVTYVLDAVLYPFWGFRLDTTPFFYFFTSPGSAMASLSWWVEVLIVIMTAAIGTGLFYALRWIWRSVPLSSIIERRMRIVATAVLTVLAAALFAPIRGGFSVATMTPGRGFFTTDMRINHLTVNPLFSLVYSISHWDDLGGMFRNFEDDRAVDIYNELCRTTVDTAAVPDTIGLRTSRPDVYIIILESFSAHLMPTLGGEDIAPHLNQIANDGVLFTDFYAESFRTDRALPAILSGYPAQPTTSAMRYTGKLGSLPSIARELARAGYATTYYYGGDADFTNMNAYLVSGGFETVVSDEDFGEAERSSKWGVHDGPLFDRVLSDVGTSSERPRFTVIQTSSSHEPFDVPYNKFANNRANAFAYADKCLGDFIAGMKHNGQWNNALIVIVPDHYGCYPENISDYAARHHVPLVITGGAVEGAPCRIATMGSQSDIAPTLLSLLGLDDSAFIFGKNLFDPASPHYAWLSEPDWYGLRTARGTTTVAVDGGMLLEGNEADADCAKAFVQLLYDDLNRR